MKLIVENMEDVESVVESNVLGACCRQTQRNYSFCHKRKARQEKFAKTMRLLPGTALLIQMHNVKYCNKKKRRVTTTDILHVLPSRTHPLADEVAKPNK
jgi:hypothetical protein